MNPYVAMTDEDIEEITQRHALAVIELAHKLCTDDGDPDGTGVLPALAEALGVWIGQHAATEAKMRDGIRLSATVCGSAAGRELHSRIKGPWGRRQ